MGRPQDIQDLMDHAVTVGGVHGITATPTAGGVPMADSDGHIADDWMGDKIARKDDSGKIPVAELPDDVVVLVNGKIPNELLMDIISGKTFKSSGNTTSSGFLLADGQDLMTYIKATTLASVQNTDYYPTGGGSTIVDANLSIPSSGVIRLTKTRNCNCNCTDCNCCG